MMIKFPRLEAGESLFISGNYPFSDKNPDRTVNVWRLILSLLLTENTAPESALPP